MAEKYAWDAPDSIGEAVERLTNFDQYPGKIASAADQAIGLGKDAATAVMEALGLSEKAGESIAPAGGAETEQRLPISSDNIRRVIMAQKGSGQPLSFTVRGNELVVPNGLPEGPLPRATGGGFGRFHDVTRSPEERRVKAARERQVKIEDENRALKRKYMEAEQGRKEKSVVNERLKALSNLSPKARQALLQQMGEPVDESVVENFEAEREEEKIEAEQKQLLGSAIEAIRSNNPRQAERIIELMGTLPPSIRKRLAGELDFYQEQQSNEWNDSVPWPFRGAVARLESPGQSNADKRKIQAWERLAAALKDQPGMLERVGNLIWGK